MLHSFRIIPDRGSWYEAQFDTSDLLYVYLDRKKRRRKFLTTTFLRALGYGTDEEMLKLFYDIEDPHGEGGREARGPARTRCWSTTSSTRTTGIVVARAFEPLSKAVVKQIADAGSARSGWWTPPG
jgi:DNA-directed RNA polymerase subunit beta